MAICDVERWLAWVACHSVAAFRVLPIGGKCHRIVFFTPGMCSARNIILLWVSNVSTSGRMVDMLVLCLLICLLMTATTAELSQWDMM